MIKKVYILFVFFLTIYILSKFNKVDTKPISIDIKNISKQENYKNANEKDLIIEKFNTQRKEVLSIFYPKISIKADVLKLDASLKYEKKLNFRMITNSIIGKESDIGSNENDFWFWSRQMDPPYLFYSNHDNLIKTRLRTPFNPKWLVKNLGIDEIKNYDKCFNYQGYYAVATFDKNNYGKKITIIDLIDLEKNAFYGHYIYNSYDEMMVSSEVKEYYYIEGSYYPKTIYINWFEENISVIWNLCQPQINVQFNENSWKMPSNYKKINLLDYKP